MAEGKLLLICAFQVMTFFRRGTCQIKGDETCAGGGLFPSRHESETLPRPPQNL